MIKFENHIILDQTSSWPEKVLQLIEEHKSSLIYYLQEEKRIEILRHTDLKIRYNRPQNPFVDTWIEVIDTIDEILQEYKIVGFHCTKLMDYEIGDVIKNGLIPLDKDFANSRINILFDKGLISKELKNRIIDKAELSEKIRAGKIFVFHCLSTLKDEWGLNKLFGLWGGESIYQYLKNSTELSQIGIPCIVVASIKIIELDIYPSLSKRMLCIYFDDNLHPHDNDSIIEKKLDVLEVIQRDNKLFNKLTNIESWIEEKIKNNT